MVVISLQRTARMRYRFRVWEVIRHAKTGNREADVEAVLGQMNQALSRAILANPEQWFWAGRRFRNRPPGEVPGADGLPPRAFPERDEARPDNDLDSDRFSQRISPPEANLPADCQ